MTDRLIWAWGVNLTVVVLSVVVGLISLIVWGCWYPVPVCALVGTLCGQRLFEIDRELDDIASR